MVRMTATAGFLREVQPGFVAHTDLSAAFSTQLSYLDATMFLSNHIAPSALHLTSMSRTNDDAPQPESVHDSHGGAHDLVCTPSYASLGAKDPRIRRQWSAYRDSIVGNDDSTISLLQQLDWQSLGKGIVVYVRHRPRSAHFEDHAQNRTDAVTSDLRHIYEKDLSSAAADVAPATRHSPNVCLTIARHAGNARSGQPTSRSAASNSKRAATCERCCRLHCAASTLALDRQRHSFTRTARSRTSITPQRPTSKSIGTHDSRPHPSTRSEFRRDQNGSAGPLTGLRASAAQQRERLGGHGADEAYRRGLQ